MKRDGYDQGFESSEGLFARDGHLTLLSLDRFDAGELTVAACEEVIEHLRVCVACSDRVESMRQDVSLLPPPGLERRGNTVAMGTLAIGATVAAAAALLLLVWPQPQQASRQFGNEGVLTASPYTTTNAELDGFSMAAGSMDVRVLAGSQVLHGRDRVPWEEAISIEVVPREPAFVAVLVATDVENEEEADDTGGIEVPDARVLLPVTRVDAPRTVEHRVDAGEMATPADERVIVVSCPERFTVGDDGDFDPDVPAPDGCTTWEIELLRYTEMADS